MKTHSVLITALALAALAVFSPALVRADAVTDWNAALGAAQKASTPVQASSTQSRSGAILHAAIFDAVNGIAKKYEPYHVAETAPAGASQSAAAVYASYKVLVALYPSQVAAFDAQLATSLGALTGSAQSIADGRAWGENVATQILAWRAKDGFSASVSFVGSNATGVWRNTTTAGATGVNAQFPAMVPFTMTSPWQFRPGAPYGQTDRLAALATSAYATELNEVKSLGSATSTTRTTGQTDLARFWNSVDIADQNRALRALVSSSASLVDNARLFALAALACADASIAGYDAKYAYAFWRPVTAIRLADTDGNAATDVDAAWTPLLTTPAHPEYVSTHSIISGSVLGTAALLLGDNHTFTLSTPGFTAITRTYSKFSEAVAEVVDARIWAGFHFRSSCLEGRDTGYEIANHVVANFLRPLPAAGENLPRMANLSARAAIGSGGMIIAGFVIEGTRQKTVLIRGIGPTLAQFGVNGVLADPKLEIVSAASGQRIAENDTWPSGLAGTFASVGAFALPAGSEDAALLLPVQPGIYTAVLSGVAGGTGEALIEIYEVP